MIKRVLLLMIFPTAGWGQVADSSRAGSVNEADSGQAASMLIPQADVLRPLYSTSAKAGAPLSATAPLLNFTSGLNLIPGISAQEGAANTAKFSYRGFGARSQYTTSHTLFYLDEIPITTLQGFSTFEDLNPQYISNAALMEQGNGLYPNALGSVVKLNSSGLLTSLGWPNLSGRNTITNLFTVGSFGLISENLLYHNSKQEISVAYENTQRRGWRENSAFERQSLYLNGKKLLGENLQLLVYGIKNRSEIPSSLSLDDFENNPERAAPGWGRIKGYEQYDKLITGITYRNYPELMAVPPTKMQVSSTLFYQYRDGFEPRPFNILDDESHHGGLRTTVMKRFEGKRASALKAFAEYHLGTENTSTFENLYDSLSGSYNNVGAGINSTQIFSQLIHAGAAFSSGFSKRDTNDYRFTYDLSLNGYYQTNQINSDIAYDIPFTVSPGLKLRYNPSKTRMLTPYFSIYRSYSIPSLAENLNPDGSLNTGLEPEKAWTGEIGLSGIILWPHHSRIYEHHSINWEADLYYSEVQNLIVPKVVGPDQVVATNSGSSRHAGLELSAGFGDYLWGKDKSLDADKSAWKYSYNLNGYYGYFVYKDFSDTTGTFSGNRLPGFPEWQLTFTGEIIYERYRKGVATRLPPLKNVSLGCQFQATGGYYINDQNTVRNEPFFLMQTWLAYQYVFEKHWMCSIKAGVKNLTNTHYAAMTVVNNQAFGHSQPRFYYPGEPVNWFSQLTIGYRF